MTIRNQPPVSSLSNAELSRFLTEHLARVEEIKREQKRRNATVSDLDRVNAKWREKFGVEPLPAYEGFAYALAWQRRRGQKRNKKLARAVSLLLLRPELFLHRREDSADLERLLTILGASAAGAAPDDVSEWVGSRGKKVAETEFERVDGKLRDLTQQPNKAACCLRPKLRDLERAYAA